MSYDLTLWHDPALRGVARAHARLTRRRRPSARERARLLAAVDALRALWLPGFTSIEPVLDEATATVGLSVTASTAEAELERLLERIRALGLVCWDPQAGVFYYADGTDSRAEQSRGGVHEGVYACLAELAGPCSPAERVEILDALGQFVGADSLDLFAAAARALPALLDELRAPGRAADKAWSVIYELCVGLRASGQPGALDPALVARLREELSAPRLAALQQGALGLV